MTDLSLHAQAVMDAYAEHNGGIETVLLYERQAVAAALRAAADAIEPIDITPDHEWLLEQLLAIAAELEGAA